jgi:hypothetical protein
VRVLPALSLTVVCTLMRSVPRRLTSERPAASSGIDTSTEPGPPVTWPLTVPSFWPVLSTSALEVTVQASSQATLIGMPRSSIVVSSSVLDRSTTTLGGVRSSATWPSAAIAVIDDALAVFAGLAASGPTGAAAPVARLIVNSSGVFWPARRRAA